MLDEKKYEAMCEAVAQIVCEIYRPNCDEYDPHTCAKCFVNSTSIGDLVTTLYNDGWLKKRKGDR